MKIYAPVKDFNGMRSNVRFVDGVGETDNKSAIEWFLSRGYTIEGEDCLDYLPYAVGMSVEKCEEISKNSHEKCDETTEPNFDPMTPNELRDWMREHGYGAKIKNTRNKEKLLEILRG